jgi:hypothetical protein
MGRIATILFAHRLGTALEPECKMYRLAADVFNDTAMVLDCLSPAFPKPFRVLILSFSSILRSLCGVCAGSAKASLSAHFAKKGNLGELNAVSWVCSARPEQRRWSKARHWRCLFVENESVGLLVLCIDDVYIGLPGCLDGATRAEIYPYGYGANFIDRKIRAKKQSYRCSECWYVPFCANFFHL